MTPPLVQIAFSVADVRRTDHWFRQCFGLLPSGGAQRSLRGTITAKVVGIPGAAATCWWLLGRNPWFQLELFEFETPQIKPMPTDARACDIGYRRIGLSAADFDATLARLAALDSLPLSEIIGAKGARRACVRSPDGVFVEIMEDDPLAAQLGGDYNDCPTAIRSITLSVADLAASSRFINDGLGLTATSLSLHKPEHETLWRLQGARLNSSLYLAGDVLLEVVQYLDPIAKPRRDGYCPSDQGLLNIAFGTRTLGAFNALYRSVTAAGAKRNFWPMHLPGLSGVYVNDPQKFSFELLRVKAGWSNRLWGFTPRAIADRPQPRER